LRDISIGGMAIDSGVGLEAGTFLSITLVDARNISRQMTVQVVRTTLQKRFWTLGCAFATPLSWDEWESLL